MFASIVMICGCTSNDDAPAQTNDVPTQADAVLVRATESLRSSCELLDITGRLMDVLRPNDPLRNEHREQWHDDCLRVGVNLKAEN